MKKPIIFLSVFLVLYIANLLILDKTTGINILPMIHPKTADDVSAKASSFNPLPLSFMKDSSNQSSGYIKPQTASQTVANLFAKTIQTKTGKEAAAANAKAQAAQQAAEEAAAKAASEAASKAAQAAEEAAKQQADLMVKEAQNKAQQEELLKKQQMLEEKNKQIAEEKTKKEALQKQQEALKKQQEALKKQQEDLIKKQEAAKKQQEEARAKAAAAAAMPKPVPAPEVKYDSPSAFESAGLIDVQNLPVKVFLDMRYATANNFTGRRLYGSSKCYLNRTVAQALVKAVFYAQNEGMYFCIYDCYRPADVQKIMWGNGSNARYLSSPGKGSNHNRGTAIDLGPCDSDGNKLPAPTGFDSFSAAASSNAKDIPADAMENRTTLQKVMKKAGFVTIPNEWWHFDYKNAKDYPVLNLKF